MVTVVTSSHCCGAVVTCSWFMEPSHTRLERSGPSTILDPHMKQIYTHIFIVILVDTTAGRGWSCLKMADPARVKHDLYKTLLDVASPTPWTSGTRSWNTPAIIQRRS